MIYVSLYEFMCINVHYNIDICIYNNEVAPQKVRHKCVAVELSGNHRRQCPISLHKTS